VIYEEGWTLRRILKRALVAFLVTLPIFLVVANTPLLYDNVDLIRDVTDDYFSGSGSDSSDWSFDPVKWLQDALNKILEYFRAMAPKDLSFLWQLVFNLFVTPFDILMVVIGFFIGMITDNDKVVDGLAIVLTAKRLVTGWASPAEYAALTAAIGIELIPLGFDVNALAIVWSVIVGKTMLFMGIGVMIARVISEKLPEGPMSTAFRIIGLIILVGVIISLFVPTSAWFSPINFYLG